jgi:hypothetical protein
MRPDNFAKVVLCLANNESFMFYGQDVAEKFGLTKPTRVLLDYLIVQNRFDMVFLSDSAQKKYERQQMDLKSTTTQSNKRHKHTEVWVILYNTF